MPFRATSIESIMTTIVGLPAPQVPQDIVGVVGTPAGVTVSVAARLRFVPHS